MKAFALFLLLIGSVGARAKTVVIPAGTYNPFFKGSAIQVASFRMDIYPVTNGEFARFVKSHPKWRRSRVPRLFADVSYLKNWSAELSPGEAGEKSPVTYVSWFAAKAYCEAQGERLPAAAEWEYVGLAGAHSRDESRSEEFKKMILDWYGRPMPGSLPAVGSTPANVYGVYDMHGLVWQWVSDFQSEMVSGGANGDSNLPAGLFCGGAAANSVDPSDYAAFMRLAFRSSLQGSFAVKDLGFRCAQDLGEHP